MLLSKDIKANAMSLGDLIMTIGNDEYVIKAAIDLSLFVMVYSSHFSSTIYSYFIFIEKIQSLTYSYIPLFFSNKA